METARAQLDAVLEPLVPSGSRCALLGFPNHSNAGDSAVWLATRAWLRRRRVSVVYACDRQGYQREGLARRLGSGTILLSGGGNLGDVWVPEQRFRERVVADFGDDPIVQLPQSVHFDHDEHRRRAVETFARHPALTLVLRDRASLAAAASLFTRATSLLAPDMAVALPTGGPMRARGRAQPEVDILWLRRSDLESAHGPAAPIAPDVEEVDWAAAAPRPLSLAKRVAEPARRVPQAGGPQRLGLGALSRSGFVLTSDAAAAIRLHRARRLLGRGRVVVTERLHGHILCLLLGIPHVLLDNSYGKLGHYHSTWTSGSPLAQLASSPAEALDRARDLVRSS